MQIDNMGNKHITCNHILPLQKMKKAKGKLLYSFFFNDYCMDQNIV